MLETALSLRSHLASSEALPSICASDSPPSHRRPLESLHLLSPSSPLLPSWLKKTPQPGFAAQSKVRCEVCTRAHGASLTAHGPENNLFLVKRLIERVDMRNPDPSTRRYTSLAWAAVLGHEETFEFLLYAGHDDEELSRVRSYTALLRDCA